MFNTVRLVNYLMVMQLLSPGDVQRAYSRIEKTVVHTPCLTNDHINAMVGTPLVFKCENLQKTGSFKFRGATNAILSLKEAGMINGHVVTHSSGNHGAALACASQMMGFSAAIVMPASAPKAKQANVKQYGAKIVFCEPTMESRQESVEKVIADTGAELIHPFDDFRIMAGQGTAVMELIGECPDLDCILTPIGGGGLLSGSATIAKFNNSTINVYGIEPEMGNDQQLSFRAKKRIGISDPDTIADGLRTTMPGEKPFASILRYVDDILTVTEEGIVSAMRLLWDQVKLVVEPSGAVPLAACLEHKFLKDYRQIGIVLSGGNLDLDRWRW